MATVKKQVKKNLVTLGAIKSKLPSISKLPKIKLDSQKIIFALSGTFYFIWIVIGIFLLLIIYSMFRQGQLNGLMGKTPQASQTTPPPVENQEVELPGIGKVNVSCVIESVPQETIAKIQETQDGSKLSAEEKDQLKKCIVAEATPKS